MNFHMTQVAHPVFNPGGDEHSENCGPTCLALGLRLLGLRPPRLPDRPRPGNRPPWLSETCTVQQWIDATRYAMFSDAKGGTVNSQKDGVEWTRTGPQKDWRKHQSLVGLDDLHRGAANCGAVCTPVRSLQEIHQALGRRSPVLLVGDPSASATFASRLGVHYQGGHVVVVVDSADGCFRVHDPLCLMGPAWLTSQDIQDFCSAKIFADQLGLALSRVHETWSDSGL